MTEDPILQLKQVSKIYKLGEQVIKALDTVDFSLKKGDFVSVMGPSGSGKSTFLQVSSMLSKPSHGHIFLKGRDVTDYDEKERAQLRNKEIGFIFQQFNLLPKLSALENVALPLIYAGLNAQQRQEQASKMLKLVGLGERLYNRPNQLSGGQQQRVAIARALVNQPAVVFADEPTGNLDSESGAEVMKLLIDLNQQGKTLIIVTHESDLGAMADRQVCLQDGQIISDSLEGCMQDETVAQKISRDENTSNIQKKTNSSKKARLKANSKPA